MKQIMIIGAGASGMMAAIAAATQGASVTILEKNERPGKKLLVTGNGKCNLTYASEKPIIPYRGADEAFIDSILAQFGQKDTLRFFEEEGMLLRQIRQGIYPYTEQAQTVLDVLLRRLRILKVKIKTMEYVTSITEKQQKFIVKTNTWQYEADAVILACGSIAMSASGADENGYQLARDMGHQIHPVVPALVPLKTADKVFHKLSGLRSQVRASLYIDDVLVDKHEGELQWTSYGVSGIVVFQLSRFASLAVEAGKNVSLRLSILKEEDAAKAASMLEHYYGQRLDQALRGIFPEKLASVLMQICHLKPADTVDRHSAAALLQVARNINLTVTGTRSYEYSQVCAGGVSTDELNRKTLESLLIPGLYMTGELLDVDGACGGYNLQWAWSTGYVAGIHAAVNK